MSAILSLTYHCTEKMLGEWEVFFVENFPKLIENHLNTEKYICSEVHTEMIHEGKNYNLLIFFNNEEERLSFLGKYDEIQSVIFKNFGQEVMDFITLLNPKMCN